MIQFILPESPYVHLMGIMLENKYTGQSDDGISDTNLNME